MNINNNKGYTLIEIITVIVILAVILAIAVPTTLFGLISSTSKNAFGSNAKLVLKSIDYKKLENPSFDETINTENNIVDLVGMPIDNINTVSVSIVDGIRTINIEGKGKWSGLFACGTYRNMDVFNSNEECGLGNGVIKQVNAPVLASSMTPIKWVDGVETTTTINDESWYDYENKLWANAKTADGSYWVWIPRYAYRITEGYQSSTAGNISIKFLNGINNNAIIDGSSVSTIPTYENNNHTNYVVHPAFNFGGTEVTGIWVAKFEASNNTGKVKVAPNAASWRGINIATMFNNSRSMETDVVYGWDNTGNGIDTHMLKNTEWGAVAYLSKSSYGINNEVWINPANDYTTGCAGNTVSSYPTSGCINAYNTILGFNASTSGNITGIYDISGGAWEYVTGNINNLPASSGLNPSLISDKYIDRYAATNNGYSSNYFGDAYYETSYNPYINGVGNGYGAWYLDYSYTPENIYPWFARGGVLSYAAGAGSFVFGRSAGGALSDLGFRPAIIVGNGL